MRWYPRGQVQTAFRSTKQIGPLDVVGFSDEEIRILLTDNAGGAGTDAGEPKRRKPLSIQCRKPATAETAGITARWLERGDHLTAIRHSA